MQSVSEDFTSSSASEIRKIIAKFEIDWDRNGVFTDETGYTTVIEVERQISEKEGGVQLGLCDVVLANETDRFTPPPTNP